MSIDTEIISWEGIPELSGGPADEHRHGEYFIGRHTGTFRGVPQMSIDTENIS
jgi:hypothetical protein